MKCERCRGCGQIANSDDGEPWADWLDLPLGSSVAVRMGLVRPIPCPVCGGSGEMDAREARIVALEQAIGWIHMHATGSWDSDPDAWMDAIRERCEAVMPALAQVSEEAHE